MHHLISIIYRNKSLCFSKNSKYLRTFSSSVHFFVSTGYVLSPFLLPWRQTVPPQEWNLQATKYGYRQNHIFQLQQQKQAEKTPMQESLQAVCLVIPGVFSCFNSFASTSISVVYKRALFLYAINKRIIPFFLSSNKTKKRLSMSRR